MIEMCIECTKEPVLIKKRRLCRNCYQKFVKKSPPLSVRNIGKFKSAVTNRKHELNREITFIKNFFDHNNYVHQPALFRINGEVYSPDFYDGERNVFIEVAGTRQAYHKNKQKYIEFKKIFPKIIFEVRQIDGALLNEDSRDKNWIK